MQREFWSDIGRELNESETCGRLLPTPTVAGNYNRKGASKKSGDGLATVVRNGDVDTALTSSAVVSPALPYQWRDDAEAWLTTDGCGPSFAELSEPSDPDTCWLKTSGGYFQRTLDGHLEEYCETWPSSGTMRGGRCFPQQPLVRRISGKECSLWRTPNATDGTNGGPNARDSSGAPHLSAQVMWRTPQARDGDPRGQQSPEKRLEGGHSVSLAEQVKWPTPTSRDWKSGSTVSDYGNSRPLSEHVSGQLNADWVSILMNFPADWTVVEDGSAECPELPADSGTESTDSAV